MPTRQRVMLKFQELIRANWVRELLLPSSSEDAGGVPQQQAGKTVNRAVRVGVGRCLG